MLLIKISYHLVSTYQSKRIDYVHIFFCKVCCFKWQIMNAELKSRWGCENIVSLFIQSRGKFWKFFFDNNAKDWVSMSWAMTPETYFCNKSIFGTLNHKCSVLWFWITFRSPLWSFSPDSSPNGSPDNCSLRLISKSNKKGFHIMKM